LATIAWRRRLEKDVILQMARWIVADIAKAVKGKLVSGFPETEIHGVSTDTRSIRGGDLFVALEGERHDGHDFVAEATGKGAAAVMVSESKAVVVEPEVAALAVPDTLSALQKFARWHRLGFQGAVIGITGSCGKTTVKELVAAVLAVKFQVAKTPLNFNNEIGVPLSVLGISDRTEVAVIELGTSAPGEISMLCDIAKPNRALITNIGRAHLEGFGTVEAVAEEKGSLVRSLAEQGTFYVNADDLFCAKIARDFPGKCVTFGEGSDAQWRVVVFKMGLDGTPSTFTVEPLGLFTMQLFGRHSILNAAAAAVIGADHGLRADEIQAGLSKAELPPMRMSIVNKGGRTFLNDAYNANPESMRAATEALVSWQGAGRKIAVVGDMLELGEVSVSQHKELGEFMASAGVDVLIALGQFAQHVAEGALGGGLTGDAVKVGGDHAEVARLLAEMSASGDVILVKGSRGAAMEKVLEEFDAFCL
jgi:UDP-N-acetylmuramoyl-tripeptide--D-alanyl-D-alanine ligase